MPAETRQQLAAAQAELVSALAGNGVPPAGFDSKRLDVTATALITKRMRAVARAWPSVLEWLRSDFGRNFDEFARQTPLSSCGGPMADGRAFVRWLSARAALPDSVLVQALHVDLQYSQAPAGLVPRRGPALRVARLHRPRRFIVVFRVPWLGV